MLINTEKKYLIVLFVLISLIIFWFILTDLLFPGNRFFPSINLVIISIKDLFDSYRFLNQLASTISVIYAAFIISFFILKIKISFFNNKFKPNNIFTVIIDLILFLPALLIGLLLIFWFDDKYLAKLIYSIFICSIVIYQILINFDQIKISDRIISAKSIGISNQKINRYIIWKFIEPQIINDFEKKQPMIWSYVIAFEFIQNYDGVGFTLRNALRFNDLAIIVSIILITSLIIFIVNRILNFISKKYFYWD